MTGPSGTPTVTDAWQALLAAEHAAIFGYAALGPQLDARDTRRAHADELSHRHDRDVIGAAVLAAGAVPVASRADYPLPGVLGSALAARRLALQLEIATGQAWRFLLATAATVGPVATGTVDAGAAGVRADALRGLTASAIRAMQWRQLIDPGAPTEPFPGI